MKRGGGAAPPPPPPPRNPPQTPTPRGQTAPPRPPPPPPEENPAMKRQPKGAKQRRQAIQVYTYAQAQSVAPYLPSIVRSVREHSLEALTDRRRLKQLTDRPGRPNRDALIEAQEL